MKQNISILGSTGSIGLSSLKIVNKKKKLFKVNILVANKNFKLISKQIEYFKPNVFVVNNFNIFKKIKKKYNNRKTIIINKLEVSKNNIKKSDITIAAIPGIAGLHPTIDIIKKSKKILIANKESIICGWNLIQNAALKFKTKIIPIDSEHFSIMKLLENQKIENVKKIYLTASGGPFLSHRISQLKKIKPEEAIKHPKWKMGKKISIDSATLMNKMLELIEAQKLFKINPKKIQIIIHPESLVHAIIEFKNGLSKFIYHDTTMIIPIANAIFDFDFNIQDFFKSKSDNLNSKLLKNFNFFKVDKKRFPIIKLQSRLNKHFSSPIILNAANEILVDQYLKKKIPFDSFYSYLLMVLNDSNFKKYAIKEPKNISQIYQIDTWARNLTLKKIQRK
jgi:1-deoxy-D-xylulose-5-phosphate reductoisomerase